VKRSVKILIFLPVISLLFSSCKEKGLDLFSNVKGTYFSTKKFALDEWTNHAGEQVSFMKTVKTGNKTDTTYVNINNMDWPEILKYFLESDISDRKYLGQYTFSQFEDNFDNTHNFLYMAVKKELPTQKLLITMDISSMAVKGIYVEINEHSLFNNYNRKLLYAPMKTIMIQEYNNPLIGSKTDKVTKYEIIVPKSE
jgi:hypothetical protein